MGVEFPFPGSLTSTFLWQAELTNNCRAEVFRHDIWDRSAELETSRKELDTVRPLEAGKGTVLGPVFCLRVTKVSEKSTLRGVGYVSHSREHGSNAITTFTR